MLTTSTASGRLEKVRIHCVECTLYVHVDSQPKLNRKDGRMLEKAWSDVRFGRSLGVVLWANVVLMQESHGTFSSVHIIQEHWKYNSMQMVKS